MADDATERDRRAALLQGLTAVDENLFEEFLRSMNDEVIPEMVRIVEERRLLAAESREWQLKC